MSGTALVTGANGFVGSHLTDRLLKEAWNVRCLVRTTSDLRWVPRDRVELVHGEVTEPESLPPAVRGADVIFHVAGITEAPTRAAYDRVNADGTAHLARAAAAASPRRFVLVSSLAAGGPSVPGRARTEEDPDAPVDLYGESKLRGEAALRENAGDVPWTVVRPPAVYGPRDRAFLVLARMAAKGWAVRISGPRQDVSLIHAFDLAEGILIAGTHERAAGRTYNLTHDETGTWYGIAVVMGEALGRRPRPLWVPRWSIPLVSRVTGFFTSLAGKKNPFPPDRVRGLLAPGWTASGARAAEEIGFRPRIGYDLGFRETVAWYAENGWLS